MSLPLEGIKVVDLSQVYLGPGTAMYLADQGAEVIKLEPPGGDSCRYMYPSGYEQFSKPFLVLNRNKRSIVVDLRKESGKAIAYRLARWADVFITNFPPGGAERLGVDYDTLSSLNPRLIYAAVSAYGEKGPEASLPGYDLVLQGRAGILGTRRLPDGEPIIPILIATDLSGMMLLSYGIMLALWERSKTGHGQKVEVSLLGMAIALQAQQLVKVGEDTAPLPGANPTPMNSCYRCEDGEYLVIVVITDKQWTSLCRVVGLEGLASDPRFSTYVGRSSRYRELKEILSKAFSSKRRDYWLAALREADVPAGPVAAREELFNDPQVVANQLFVKQPHPVASKVMMMGLPLRLSASSGAQWLRRPAPSPGEHTDEVLRELGYTHEDIMSLRATGAVM